MPRIAPLPALLAAALATALAAPLAAGVGPSVDCGGSASVTEQLVCARPDLAAMNRTMQSLYEQRLAGVAPADARDLRKVQHDWLARRDACAIRRRDSTSSEKSVEACLLAAIEGRIVDLTAIGEHDEANAPAAAATGSSIGS